MTLSAIYLLDMKGKVLVSRNYRGDIESNLIDKFIGLVSEKVFGCSENGHFKFNYSMMTV